MDRLELYQDSLKRAGLRLTGQRQAICAWLASTDTHPTPYQVYEEISRTHPEISRATVYNTLNTLQQLGAIVELSFGADHTHYDTNPQPHVNLICLRCHRITDMEASDALVGMEALVDGEQGFHGLVARAEVLGLCAGCHAAQQRTQPPVAESGTPTKPHSPHPIARKVATS